MAIRFSITDRRAEYVRVLTVIIAELELRNMQRQVFAAYFVETAPAHAPLPASGGLRADGAVQIPELRLGHQLSADVRMLRNVRIRQGERAFSVFGLF
jgi:hypothetical protein